MSEPGLVLITGGAGFIGSHLVEALLAEQCRVRVVDNLSTGHRANLAHVEGRYEWLEGDLADPEICRQAVRGVGTVFHEAAIPIRREVHAACELLGLDPLYVANEGKLIAVVPPEDAEHLLEVMRGHPLGRNAAVVGEVVAEHPGLVLLRSVVGGERVVTLLAGEQLPRIC